MPGRGSGWSMTLPLATAQQYQPGVGTRAHLFEGNDPEPKMQLTATDFSGRELPLYMQVETELPEGVQPLYFCPCCGDGLLAGGAIIGGNNMTARTCPVCGVKWATAEDLAPGVALTMR